MGKKKISKLINNKLLSFILVIIIFCGLFYYLNLNNIQKTGLTANSKITKEEINYYLDNLNRKRFTEDEKELIRNFIKSEFQKYGYNVSEQKTDGNIEGMNIDRVFINIIAEKENIQDNYILIGAHYDTVPGTIGMDDNASGVAALLAVAQYNQNPNVRFVAFDGEEYNLTGSRYYAKNISPRPQLMVSLETMGYYSEKPNTQSLPQYYDLAYRGLYNRLKSSQHRGNFSASVCSHNAKSFCEDYESLASSLNLEVYTANIPGVSFIRNFFLDLFRSDHTPFLLEDIPAVMITDTANFRTPNYHKPTDTRETVNAEFITKQSNALLGVLSK